MADVVMRLALLLGVIVLLWLMVWVVRHFVEWQRQAVLALPATNDGLTTEGASIRILAFSTPDCRQCHTMQAPALERLVTTYGEKIHVEKVDAVQEPVLAQQYRVMTVPSTVVLDTRGQVQAVNYGFAPTKRLAEQIDALLGQKKLA
jgi:thiol-disulfide isomerase/thioredoxin